MPLLPEDEHWNEAVDACISHVRTFAPQVVDHLSTLKRTTNTTGVYWPSSLEVMRRQLGILLMRTRQMLLNMDDVKAALSENTSEEDQLAEILTQTIAANQDLSTKLTAALAANDQAAIQAVIDQINANTAAAKTAINAAQSGSGATSGSGGGTSGAGGTVSNGGTVDTGGTVSGGGTVDTGGTAAGGGTVDTGTASNGGTVSNGGTAGV